MDTRLQRIIKDLAYHSKVACHYYPEEGAIEIKLFGCRIMRITFPKGTPIYFAFFDAGKST